MIAKGDRTYCVNKECKNKCERHESKWEFEKDRFYSFIEKCENNHNIRMKNV